ncbi:hypothetical protein [Acetilactobacillus jinshanensis]|uniref:Uncharacterized protein n=1 Tax=Acetilactobacillus jinshanensis TaxID=1720083 RepID=A0A4P6ZJK0_9LACO|nr:hypothetical protein [Acetilactobacillus jinshanensis]QBP17794.1 hypothetical protein ELX58_01100 [Acetilactobacillus jinshanensis]URL60657.1 hypothetical protein HGK75_01130 [uncultured bacterium]
MDKKAELQKLEAQKNKLEDQISKLEGNKFVAKGTKLGKKLFSEFKKMHKHMHNHGFAEWKKNYVVLKREDYKQLKTSIGFYKAKYRDAMLRANNLHTNLR